MRSITDKSFLVLFFKKELLPFRFALRAIQAGVRRPHVTLQKVH
jgi:hypothetical protein